MSQRVDTLYSDALKKIVLTLRHDTDAKDFCDGDGCVRILLTENEGTLAYGDRVESFSAGDVFLFDQQKSLSVSDGTSLLLLKFNFSDFIDAEYKVFPKNDLGRLLSRMDSSAERLNGIHINTKRIQDALYMVENEFENQNESTYCVIKAYVILILSLAMQYLFDGLDGGGINKCAYYKDVEKSLVYIGEHLSEKLTLDELSRVAGMGKTNYSTAFKNVTGMTVWEYILNARIELASSYLVEKKDDFNITEIAMMSGFNSVTHFTKTFKKIKGNTPREFKNNPQNPCF